MSGTSVLRFSRLACGLIVTTVPFAASVAAQSTAAPSSGAPASAISLLQVFFALIVVLATIWGFAWLMRRFTPGQAGGSGALKVVGGVMVGPRERVVVVEVGDTWLLVGVAGGNVSLVHSMPRPSDIPAASSTPGGGFSRTLQRALRTGGNRQ